MACRDWAAKVGGGVLGRVWALVAALALLLGLAAFAPAPAQAASFKDVPSGQWYTSWVDKASDQGLMLGFTDPATGRPTGYFGPDEPLTRAQVATVLWRMAGGPSSGHASFPDVERGSWYDAPVAWCVKAGVVTGYTSGPDKGHFRPDRPVTRQELATMVHRYAKYAGMDVADPDPTAFRSTTDWRTADSWASEALTWTAAAGVLSGVDNHDGTYSVVPFGTATRAMAAKVFVVLSGSPSAAKASYTVTFDSNGGSAVKAQTVKNGAKASRPADPAKAGHTFKGWYSDKSLTKAYSFNSAVKSNLTLYAKWSAKAAYTVTFNANGGTAVKAQSVSSGAKASKPADPAKSGQVFAGWYTDAALTKAYNFNSAVKSNLTLYAKWMAKSQPYAVLYKDGLLSLQIGDDTDPSHGEVFGKWAWDGSSRPWYDKRARVRSVVARDGAAVYGSVMAMFSNLSNCRSMDLSRLNVSDTSNLSFMFQGCSSLTSLDLSGWDVSSASGLSWMFSGCSSLTSLDVSGWDVSNASSLSGMFYGCSTLTSLDVSGWGVSNASDLSGMFQGCSSLTSLDVSGWDVSNASSLSSMFGNCSSLASFNLSGWDVSNASDLSYMFCGCSSLASLDLSGWDVSSASSLSWMFKGCSSLASLDVSGWDVSNASDLSYMFCGCSSLTSHGLSGWDVSNASDLSWMFSGCSSLTSLDLSGWDVSNASRLYDMFLGCSSLASLDLSGWDVSSASDLIGMFSDCSSLGTVTLGAGCGPLVGELPYGPWYDAEGKEYDRPPAGVAGTFTKVKPEAHTVAFDPNGGSAVKAQTVRNGAKASKPADPVKPGCVFAGWYADAALTKAYDFDSAVRSDLNLYAKWEKEPQPYAVLYKDGLLSLQVGDDTEPSHGEVLGKWAWDGSSRPWGDESFRVRSVVARDRITVSYGQELFSSLSNCGSMDLSRLDVSGASDLSFMFCNCWSLTSLDLSGWDVSGASDLGGVFSGCSSLASLDVSGWDVSNASDLGGVFSGCSSLASLDVSGWDVSGASRLSGMFSGCSSLTSLDLSGWDVSNVTSFTNSSFIGWGMFSGCSSLTSLDVSDWDVSGASDLSDMFYGCSSLTSLDVSGWDVSNTLDLSYMFEGCSSLTSLDVSGWDVSSASDLSDMFSGCSSLTSLDLSGWDVSGASRLSGMFEGCSSLTSLDVSGWDVSGASDLSVLSSMFYGCSSLTSLDLSGWDVSRARDLSHMFYGCSSLASLDLSGWDVSSASHLSDMFYGCSSLASLDLSGWDVSNAWYLDGMFSGCPSLGTVTLGAGCGPLVGELPYGPWYDAEGKEYDRPPAGVAGTFTKTKPATQAVAADAVSDADALLPAQIVEGEQDGLRFAVVPEGASFEYGLEYPELAGRYVGPGVYLTGYVGESDSLVVPLEVAGVPVVSANLSRNDSDRAGMTRLAAVSFERVEGKVSSLAQLDVSGNGLSSLVIEGLDALVRLNCEGNPIADLATLQAWAVQDGHEAKLPQVQDAAPAEPDDAVVPSEPSAPEQPSEPDTPAVEPGEPSEPEVPSEPSEPEIPAEPEVPSEPETPSEEPAPDEGTSDDSIASDEGDPVSDSLELGEDPVSALAA